VGLSRTLAATITGSSDLIERLIQHLEEISSLATRQKERLKALIVQLKSLQEDVDKIDDVAISIEGKLRSELITPASSDTVSQQTARILLLGSYDIADLASAAQEIALDLTRTDGDGIADVVISEFINELTAGDQHGVYNNARSKGAQSRTMPQSRAVLDPDISSVLGGGDSAPDLTADQTMLIDALLGKSAQVSKMGDYMSSRKIAKRIVDYVKDPENAAMLTRDMRDLAEALAGSLLSVEAGGTSASISRAINARAVTIEGALREIKGAVVRLKKPTGDADVDQSLSALGEYMAATGMISRDQLEVASQVREPTAPSGTFVGGETEAAPISEPEVIRSSMYGAYGADAQAQRSARASKLTPAMIPTAVAPDLPFAEPLAVRAKLDDFLREHPDISVQGRAIADMSLGQLRTLLSSKLLSKSRPPLLTEEEEKALILLAAAAQDAIAELRIKQLTPRTQEITREEAGRIAADAMQEAASTALGDSVGRIQTLINQIRRSR
jgi:hypothetical protein